MVFSEVQMHMFLTLSQLWDIVFGTLRYTHALNLHKTLTTLHAAPARLSQSK